MTPEAPAAPDRKPNLALLHQETITSIVRLRSGRLKVTDAKYFRGQIREMLGKARDEGGRLGYSKQAVDDSQFAIVAFLDTTAVELSSEVFDDWMTKPLLEEMFGAQGGGSRFIKTFEELMRQPDSAAVADTLEIYLLCLLLGYVGADTGAATADFAKQCEAAMERVRRTREYTAEFSPAWRAPAQTDRLKTVARPMKRGLIVALAAVLALVLVFTAYKVTISSGVSELHAAASSGGPR